mmetsp:Transcript_9407/g.12806  ORF Transcript_9407/g.12806 Transcript_9407/m.12806 type:complete len:101 (+) Transcript_9407:1044-1346(+)
MPLAHGCLLFVKFESLDKFGEAASGQTRAILVHRAGECAMIVLFTLTVGLEQLNRGVFALLSLLVAHLVEEHVYPIIDPGALPSAIATLGLAIAEAPTGS